MKYIRKVFVVLAIIFIFVVFIFIAYSAISITLFSHSKISFYEQVPYIVNIGYIGSFISGATAIVIVLLTSLAVYFSKKTYLEEIDRATNQRFEDRFFKLLEIHRENVHEMRISHKSYDDSIHLDREDKGSKVILSIVRELLAINKFILKNEINLNLIKYKLSNRERMELSYVILFFGLGKRSNKVAEKYLEYLSYKVNIKGIVNALTDTNNRKLISEEAPIKYKSVGGHQTRLGHYFRNLYFCIKVIDENNKLSNEQKLDYAKNVRVQLNTYEQILLLVNSLTHLGKSWEKYIVVYQLLRNIPYNMLDERNEFSVEKHISVLCQKYAEDICKLHRKSWEEFYNDYFEFKDYPKLK